MLLLIDIRRRILELFVDVVIHVLREHRPRHILPMVVVLPCYAE